MKTQFQKKYSLAFTYCFLFKRNVAKEGRDVRLEKVQYSLIIPILLREVNTNS